MIGVALRVCLSRGRHLHKNNVSSIVRKGKVVQAQLHRQSPSLLSRGFSKTSDDQEKGNKAFSDLIKKMKSGNRSDDEAKEEEKQKSADEGQPKTEETSQEAVGEGDEEEISGDSTEEKQDGDKEDDKDSTESSGMKFEVPKFDAEQAQAFIASIPGRARLFADSFMTNVKEAYSELQGKNNKKSGLRTKVQQAESFRRGDTAEEDKNEDKKEKGPSAIVHVKEATSEWEKMKQRLSNNPLIREILKGSKKAYNAAADTDIGQKVEDAGERVKERMEDAREFWETSQNPIVYTLSGVWDNMTGDTEEGIVTSEILKLDPDFDKEIWAEELRVNLVPDLIKAHLTGDIDLLAEHLGEGILNTLTQDIKLRESEKVAFDTNLLDVDEMAIEMNYNEDRGPVIVNTYMVQQINCVRKAGEIIEGSEDAVVAKIYRMAFAQEYLEEEGEVRWKVVAYEFGNETPYI